MVARVAEACNDRFCSHLLVRGDVIQFVSVEQFRRMGGIKRQPEQPGPGWQFVVEDEQTRAGYWTPPTDIKLPQNFVLVHDTSGELLTRCEMYIVRWHNGARQTSSMHRDDINAALDYFKHGDKPTPPSEIKLRVGSVDIPKKPAWGRRTKVRIIRYRRHGFRDGMDHIYEWDPAVWLYSSTRGPLAFRLSLPNGCIADWRGFVKP